MFRTALAVSLLLFASPALAVQPTPIAFETIVSLDKFRVTNDSPSAHIFQVEIRPQVDGLTTTASHEEMSITRQPPPFPNDPHTGWLLSRFPPGRWMEVNGPVPVGSQLWVEFAEPLTQARGWVYGTVQNGRFEGFTVPEPGAWVLGLVAVISFLHLARSRRTPRCQAGRG